MISYIIPYKLRSQLLRLNLFTLLSQTDKDFEVVITDYLSNDNLPDIINEFRDKGLSIRCYIVDATRCPFSHDSHIYHGMFSPAIGQNVAAKKSKGDILILTSPEVVNANTNVEVVKKKFSDGKPKFLLGWIDEIRATMFPYAGSGVTAEQIKALIPYYGPDGAKCREECWAPERYFLGCIRKNDFMRIGGVEEKYMAGMAFEDNDFANRCAVHGFPATLDTDIAGIHLAHGRGYQGILATESNPNYVLWNSQKPDVANRDHDWGSDNYIVGEL